ncbi:rhomboid family intramembrane serine protease [Denitromonas iodatirespirans]|uniref:Rhomboid family intramembrane serine protease n=1 Tax=Denitromonas iodatirespirans TaxID=2795389 RepID=A0A944D8R2_DENI1|nr:rhomboid family intramembrane serine protease [Denitromonas iodatirespirans]MBT0962024.1 rhomboid family intramembrane serine protease [Denitromonas iodatirespirans]
MPAPRMPTPEEFIDALFARVPVIWASVGLIGANLLIFAALAVAAGALWHVPGALLADWGGNYAVQTHGGQPWRLVTGLFLHGGLLHVALNMLALYQGGQLAERVFGSRPFLMLYLACGVVASVASVWWRPSGLSIGASGAVFGVFGALLGYVLVCRHAVPVAIARRLRRGLLIFIAYSLAAGVLLPGIDNAAHLGGLLTGIVLGAALAPVPGPGAGARRTLAAALVGLAAAGLWLAVPPPPQPRPAATVSIEAPLRHLLETEQRLVTRYHLVLDALRSGQMPVGDALRVIETELMPGWAALADAFDAAPASALQAPAFARYARLQREVLQAQAMGLQTGDRRWTELAIALQASADALIRDTLRADGAAPR